MCEVNKRSVMRNGKGKSHTHRQAGLIVQSDSVVIGETVTHDEYTILLTCGVPNRLFDMLSSYRMQPQMIRDKLGISSWHRKHTSMMHVDIRHTGGFPHLRYSVHRPAAHPFSARCESGCGAQTTEHLTHLRQDVAAGWVV